ncbi:hypothetical protein MAP00_006914 [Monascus purpureus]|nr:hypothetical protein MAP00_006914 [Monascus purpureus]
MRFIAANTSVPVPQVYNASFGDEEEEEKEEDSGIVMEYIPGESLDKAWAKLTITRESLPASNLLDISLNSKV